MNTYRNSILSPLKQEKPLKLFTSRASNKFSALESSPLRNLTVLWYGPKSALYAVPHFIYRYFRYPSMVCCFVLSCLFSFVCFCLDLYLFFFFHQRVFTQVTYIQMKMWISVSLSFALSFITMNELCHFAKITCPLVSGCSELILYWIGFNQGPGISTFQFQYKRRPTLSWMTVCMFAIKSVKWF